MPIDLPDSPTCHTDKVVKGGQTLSATEFSRLCGVTRERLRTWERRHGFPEPVRHEQGARRYSLDDVTRVLAVRRAIETGVPVATAIAAARHVAADGNIDDGEAAALAEHAPIAVVALSGPEPLRFEYVNAAVRAQPGAPAPGELLLDLVPWFAGEPGHDALLRVFAGTAIAAGCEHPDWTRGMNERARSIAYRLPYQAGRAPLVALVGVDTRQERELRTALSDAERVADEQRAEADEIERWADAAAAVVEPLSRQSGPAALSAATDALVRALGASDVAIATSLAGALGVGRSARGRLGPAMVTVAAHDELDGALRTRVPAWLTHAAARAFGAPDGLELLVVPAAAAGEPLGALLVGFPERAVLPDRALRLAGVAAAVIGFALVRAQVGDQLLGPGQA